MMMEFPKICLGLVHVPGEWFDETQSNLFPNSILARLVDL